MKNGTVNVRTRANEIKGEVRVDEFAERLVDEIPKPSASYDSYYKKAWKAEDFGLEPRAGQGV